MTRATRLLPEHADAMADLHRRVFRSGDAWSADAFRQNLSLASSRAIGRWQDAKLAAFLVVQYVAPDAEILTIATAPEVQRRGFARDLVAYLERDLSASGLKKWLLDVAADNPAAISFYENIGFQRDGRRSGYYNRLEGPRIDAILMTKHLARQETH
ncbi:MAG: GNAT family N-acetyltransferase [Henriciella sp.]